MKNLPDKIYLATIEEKKQNLDNAFVGIAHKDPEDIIEPIEYVRTDAFIEKALKWYCLDCECNDNCNADYKCFFRQEYKRYLEGNNNAIPPKFDNAINPDGSMTENYRYRHFIRKVRDAFIEKACDAYCKVCGHYSHTTPNHICRQACDYYKDFRNYMKGE